MSEIPDEFLNEEPIAMILPARFYPRLDRLAKEYKMSVTGFFEQMLKTWERALEAELLAQKAQDKK